MSLFDIVEPHKDLQRGMYAGTVKSFKISEAGKEIEVKFTFGAFGEIDKIYPKQFKSETDERKELEEIAGKPLRVAKEEDFVNHEVVAFLTLKRGSGGRIEYAIGPVFSSARFKEMTSSLSSSEQRTTTNPEPSKQ